jgi:2'-5' RNA ligase
MEAKNMMRAFVGIDINEAVRQNLLAAQRQLTGTGAQMKLVEPENIHVTMKFLGDIREDQTGAITEALRAAAEGVKSFEISVRGVGAFPNISYIRVIWAGVSDGREQIISIQKRIDQNLAKLGFKPERDFVPHLTLARVKSAAGKEKLVSFLKTMTNAEFGSSRADAIELKQSTLTPKGPIYSALARIELA